MQENNSQYYVALDNEVYGPYSLEGLFDLGLLPDTMVCTDNSGWALASQYPELQHLFAHNDELSDEFDGYELDVDGNDELDDELDDDDYEEERAIHRRNSGRLFDNRMLIYKQKRKAALIGVLTLGLAGLTVIGVGNAWRNNIFEGVSFNQGPLKFVLKIISFMFVSAIVAIPFFIISLVRLIYYQIKISSLN